jgi:hypothetical protein
VLYEALSHPAARLLPSANSATLGMLLHAYARAAAPLPAPVAAAARSLLRRPGSMRSMPTPCLVQAVWAMARLQAGDAGVYAAAVREAAGRLPRMGTHDLSLLLWSLSSAGVYDGALMGAAAPLLTQRLQQEPWDEQALCNVAFAYGQTRHYHPPLVAAIAAAAQQHASQLLGSCTATGVLLQALAQLQHRDDALVTCLAQHMVAGVGSSSGSRREAAAGSRRSRGEAAAGSRRSRGEAAAAEAAADALAATWRFMQRHGWRRRSVAAVAWALAHLGHVDHSAMVAACVQWYSHPGSRPGQPSGGGDGSSADPYDQGRPSGGDAEGTW